VVVFTIRPIVTYGAETWTMTKKEEQALLIFERKKFRIIYGPKYESGEWKRRTNRELEEMSKGENIVKWIKGRKGQVGWVTWREWKRTGCPKRSFKNWRYEAKRTAQERMERRSRKRSASAGSEKMERVGDR
jgi:hypothetical protein